MKPPKLFTTRMYFSVLFYVPPREDSENLVADCIMVKTNILRFLKKHDNTYECKHTLIDKVNFTVVVKTRHKQHSHKFIFYIFVCKSILLLLLLLSLLSLFT